jgi:hypothetical protein
MSTKLKVMTTIGLWLTTMVVVCLILTDSLISIVVSALMVAICLILSIMLFWSEIKKIPNLFVISWQNIQKWWILLSRDKKDWVIASPWIILSAVMIIYLKTR